MRITACALSAVLLSGCSWFGGYGPSSHDAYYQGAQSQGYYAHGNNYAAAAPAQGSYGGFPQEPDFGGGYTTGGYGSHADSAGHHDSHSDTKRIKKPRLRGSLSLGWEKSGSGHLLDYSRVPGIDPETAYNPDDYAEGTTTGSPATGQVIQTTYTGAVEKIHKPNISFDDVYSTPTRVAAGLEYILSPKATLYANGGYSHAQGEKGTYVEVIATLLRHTDTTDFDAGPPVVQLGPTGRSTSFIPNASIAGFEYNFNDMQRYDLELGGRFYFDPVIKDQAHRTLTPFVAGSVGMAHYNETKFEVSQQQLFYQRAFDSDLMTLDYYDVPQPTVNTQLYDAQWVPTGALTAGMEWQLTPKAALALETGVKFEGARDYSNGAKGDNNIAVPLTLRGSFNF